MGVSMSLSLEYTQISNVYYFITFLSMSSLCFQLEGLEIKYTDTAPEKIREDCCPGQPFITFCSEPFVTVEAVNPQPQNGLFAEQMRVMEGDTVSRLTARLAKNSRAIKGKELYKVRVI
jgi:leucyl-tRNA synthetase